MGKRKAIISSYVGVIVLASIIFLAGGKLIYWQAILYLILAIIGTTLTHILSPIEYNLAERRVKNANKGELWDRKILGFAFLINILTFIIAGLDSGRYGWSGNFPFIFTIAGAVVMLIGQLIFALARKENEFFSSTVQIENERLHTVCKTGLYKIIRHPGYLGMITSLFAFPFVLGSFWSIIPVGASIIIIFLRTQLEDNFLKDKLNEYNEYSKEVKYKLIPYIF